MAKAIRADTRPNRVKRRKGRYTGMIRANAGGSNAASRAMRVARALAAAVPVVVALAVAATANAGSITYCNEVNVQPGYFCTQPPGNATDPCDSSQHAWGGWAQNYYDTYQSGRYPYGYVQLENEPNYPNSCGGYFYCYYSSATLHHFSDSGCAATYSWNVGKYVDLMVGTGTGTQYTWLIYGTGSWP